LRRWVAAHTNACFSAFSFEHDPHIIVCTADIPGGAI
jgi:hypothetical protein